MSAPRPRRPAGVSIAEAVTIWGDSWAVAYFGLGGLHGFGFSPDEMDADIMDWCSLAIEEDGRADSMADRASIGLP